MTRSSVTSRLRRNSGPAALGISVLALVSTFTGVSDAARDAIREAVSKPKPGAVLRLDSHGKFPVKAIPKVTSAKTADRLGTLKASDVKLACPSGSVDLGTWCIGAAPYPLQPEDRGKNDFFFATKACETDGGWLPSAAELIGAASKVKLASYLDDDESTALKDVDDTDGLTDRREMSSTLVTTQAGASAAGALGVSAGSRGNPLVGEPNPVVIPAVPAPDSLSYVTVVDNHDRGGFAGAQPIGQTQTFRCAYAKVQGGGKSSSAAADEG